MSASSINSLKDEPAVGSEAELIDKEELRRRLSLPSVRMVDELMRRRKIPYVRLGHRTVRFSWPKVLAAISRLECRALGDG